MSGNVKCMDLFINAGADVNVRYECDSTALFEAIETGNEDIAKKLIKVGANVNEKGDWNKSTPLILASECYKLHLETPSCDFGRCLNLLIEAGADVNATDSHGYLALIKVVENGNRKG